MEPVGSGSRLEDVPGTAALRVKVNNGMLNSKRFSDCWIGDGRTEVIGLFCLGWKITIV